MTEPVWLDRRTLELLHSESIAEHGGLPGLRDEGLFESALSRARNLWAYEGVEDVARLGAAYGIGLAKNHPFADGNKRIAFIACALFVELNGYQFTASQVEAAAVMLGVAAGDVVEEDLADWVRANSLSRG